MLQIGSQIKRVPAAGPGRAPWIVSFRELVYRAYEKHGRDFRWRRTRDPYEILVSEVMLQQTQVQRVARKFPEFLAAFPTFGDLDVAPVSKVLEVWQGMGYNRRAIALKRTAEQVLRCWNGELPRTQEALQGLPGVGAATAGAILAYAYDIPAVFVETNIRRAFIHTFFEDDQPVPDSAIRPLVEETLDTARPRTWYYALTDYGVILRQHVENPNRRSRHYRRQSPFEGSRRQVRSGIVRALVADQSLDLEALVARLSRAPAEMSAILFELEGEGLVKRDGDSWSLP